MNTTQFYKLLVVPSSVDRQTFADLQSLVAQYPWFSLAHQLLFETASRDSNPEATGYSNLLAVYANSRSRFYWRLQKPTVERMKALDEDTAIAEMSKRAERKISEKQVVVLGGDYFAAADFEEVTITDNDPLSHFIVTQPKLNPNAAVLSAIDFNDVDEKRVISLDFVTETLAQIYVNQQLYGIAIDTYKKLILQIPEKSAYFAAQIKELKKLK